MYWPVRPSVVCSHRLCATLKADESTWCITLRDRMTFVYPLPRAGTGDNAFPLFRLETPCVTDLTTSGMSLAKPRGRDTPALPGKPGTRKPGTAPEVFPVFLILNARPQTQTNVCPQH